MAFTGDLLLALGFCTRLAPARGASGRELARGMFWFPLVGLGLGLLLALPPWFGLLEPAPWVMAWLLTGASVWITRGLHWDGWADLWDGWGSCAQGERFWAILKDSRAGAFGVLGLALGLLGQTVLFHAMLEAGALGAIVWCPLLGRCAVPWTAWRCRNLAREGMGGSFLRAAGVLQLLPVLAAMLLAGWMLLSWAGVAVSAALLLVFVWRLERLARQQGGCNGDFLGAAVIAGELCAGAGWALTL